MKSEAATILVPGVYRRHSETPQSPNAVVTDEERLRITTERNSKEYFKKVFLNPKEKRSLRFQKFDKGGVVHTIQQLQPWETGAAMVVAASEDIVAEKVSTDQNGRVPVQFVYEADQGYHPELQVGYHTELLRLMRVMKDTPLPGETFSPDRPPVVAMENAVGTLGKGRTLSLQHGVVVKTGMPVDTQTKPHFAKDLNLEQHLKLSYPEPDALVDDIASKMEEDLDPLGISLGFALRRDEKPYGYTIETPIMEDGNLEQNGDLLATIMQSHYRNAKEILTKLQGDLGPLGDKIQQRGLVEPYAYRHYFYFRPDEQGISRLYITVSPALLGGAAKEDAGGELQRSPDFDRQITPDQEAKYQKQLRSKLNPSSQ